MVLFNHELYARPFMLRINMKLASKTAIYLNGKLINGTYHSNLDINDKA